MNARVLALAVVVGACQVQTTPTGKSGPGADVAYLASAALAGRMAGTSGGREAARFIERRYEELGLDGVFPHPCANAPECHAGHFQAFNFNGRLAQNVAAVVPGADSTLRSEYVVVGAHFDHLGRLIQHKLDPKLGAAFMYPGADDNASGTAGVLELARRFAQRPSRRPILFVNFDAEELGLVGSRAFIDHPPVPVESIVFMLNLDMIGRLRDNLLLVDAPNDSATRAVITNASAGTELHIQYTTEIESRSDHASFVSAGITAVALFTGFHVDYHKPTDISSRVDVPGLIRVVDLADAIVRAKADR